MLEKQIPREVTPMQPPQHTDLVPVTTAPARLQEPIITTLTAQIVSAHVAHNSVSPSELPDLIRAVYTSLANVSRVEVSEPSKPAIPVKQSVRSDAVVCLECGKEFAMIKRHLRTSHQLNEQQYREKWRLPSNYPLVSPAYSKVRTRLAKKIGLGRLPRARQKRRAAK